MLTRSSGHGLFRARALRALAGAATALALLAGCAGTYLLDNTVQSFSSLQAVPAQASYRFERLPSQVNDPTQPQLETLAGAALARVGLRRDEVAPRLTVQAWARVQRAVSPWARPAWGPWGGWGWGGVGVGGHHSGVGIGVGMPLGAMDSPWYQREVGIVMRDTATGTVVYETHAYNDGPWLEPNLVTGAMFEAALQGFPQAPAGQRRVNIQLQR